jgi:hypothetical protein
MLSASSVSLMYLIRCRLTDMYEIWLTVTAATGKPRRFPQVYCGCSCWQGQGCQHCLCVPGLRVSYLPNDLDSRSLVYVSFYLTTIGSDATLQACMSCASTSPELHSLLLHQHVLHTAHGILHM